MLILISHAGTEQTNDAVTRIKNYIEEKFGATVEIVEGMYDEPIILLNDDYEEIGSLDPNNLNLEMIDFMI